ncbi:hemolytic enterotoxin [Bacillus thuringiensis]|nr:HBL/NHE enterotoxin family protein [Bacillus thuringiensis]PEZ46364.1 hemolytic enterotoxin [Bacillus thuringiensis]PGY62889.1 hemolytic enterotoxin [Bacillus thuringiensis]
MKVQYYQKSAITLMIGILTSNLFPMFSEAEKHTQATIFDKEQQEIYPLRLIDVKSVLAQTSSAMISMKSYVENIRKQSEVHLSRIPAINDNLCLDIMRHQINAQKHAENWMQVKEHILGANQNIIQFNNQFQSYYERLSMNIQHQQIGDFKSNIKGLVDLISQNKAKSDQLTIIIQEFDSNIKEDVRSLKKDLNTLLPIVNSATGGIVDLQEKIDYYNSIIIQNKDILWNLISSGHATAQNLADTRKKIAWAEENSQILKINLSGIQSDVAILTDIQKNTISMVEIITAAIKALQEIIQQWDIVQLKYSVILKCIDNIGRKGFKLMQLKLNITKKEWQDLREYAEQLYRLNECE